MCQARGVERSYPLSIWLVSNSVNGTWRVTIDGYTTGSERARNAKTAGATLAEAGKINESLMYLGQCLQMQSDCHDGTKVFVLQTSQFPSR